MQICDIARGMQRDMVHVAFTSMEADAEPVGVSLAVRQDSFVQWLPACRLYAASETARIELLAADRRWLIGARNVLTSVELPPRSRRAQGEEIAMRRWQQAATSMKPLTLEGSAWVPVGKRYADAIPQDKLQVAA